VARHRRGRSVRQTPDIGQCLHAIRSQAVCTCDPLTRRGSSFKRPSLARRPHTHSCTLRFIFCLSRNVASLDPTIPHSARLRATLLVYRTQAAWCSRRLWCALTRRRAEDTHRAERYSTHMLNECSCAGLCEYRPKHASHDCACGGLLGSDAERWFESHDDATLLRQNAFLNSNAVSCCWAELDYCEPVAMHMASSSRSNYDYKSATQACGSVCITASADGTDRLVARLIEGAYATKARVSELHRAITCGTLQ